MSLELSTFRKIRPSNQKTNMSIRSIYRRSIFKLGFVTG